MAAAGGKMNGQGRAAGGGQQLPAVPGRWGLALGGPGRQRGAAACPEGNGWAPSTPGHRHRWSCRHGRPGLPSGSITPAVV